MNNFKIVYFQYREKGRLATKRSQKRLQCDSHEKQQNQTRYKSREIIKKNFYRPGLCLEVEQNEGDILFISTKKFV